MDYTTFLYKATYSSWFLFLMIFIVDISKFAVFEKCNAIPDFVYLIVISIALSLSAASFVCFVFY